MSNSTLDIYKTIAEASGAGIKAASKITRGSNKGVAGPLTLSAPSVKPANPVGTALDKNYAAQSQNVLDKYNTAQKELEESRVRAKKEASFDNTKLMKYMPSILKRQGLSGLGVSQSAVIAANNNYGRQLTDIENDFQKNSADLLQNYNDAKLAYDTQYNTQKAQLEQAEIDKAEADEKEKAKESEDAIERAYKQALDLITNDTLSTDFSSVLASAQAAGVTGSDYEHLMGVANQQIAANKKAVEDKDTADRDAEWADTYENVYKIITNDSFTTDFTSVLSNLVAGQNISEQQYAMLQTLAQSQAEINKQKSAETDTSDILANLQTLYEGGTYEEAMQYLESMKERLPEGTYATQKYLIEAILGESNNESGEIVDPNHPNYNQQGPGYKGLTQEQKDDRIIQGLDNIASGGRDYKITSEALGADSYFLTNPEFVAKLAAEGIDIHDTNLNAKQPNNGMVVEFRGRKDGSMGIGEYNIISKYESGEYPHSMRNSYYSAVAPNNTAHIAVYYNGQWYLAEDKGETKKQDIGTGKIDPLGVYKPYTVPQYASDSNVVSGIFDKYKQ